MEFNPSHSTSIQTLAKTIQFTLDTPFVTICIGTDRCIGDCLGPLVGHELLNNNFPYPVYGTLKNPIHALNMVEEIAAIKFIHSDLPILAIDASLGKKESVGNIHYKKGPISPGKGVGKILPNIGDYSLIGVVDAYNNLDNLNLHQVRLHFIHEMAQFITQSLLLSIP